MIKLINGDCLDSMVAFPSHSIDAVIADLPYGSTALAWDRVIDLEAMWLNFRRLIKPKGAIVLFADFRFAVKLYSSAPDGWFKYDLVWEKTRPSGFFNCKNKPLNTHENILVFSDGTTANRSPNRMAYYPRDLGPGGKLFHNNFKIESASSGPRPSHAKTYLSSASGYPRSVTRFKNVQSDHPTQKPVDLMEFIVKTYTNEGETVFDPTMGSGSTGVACLNLGRSFIGIERDPGYFKIAKARIKEATARCA